MWMKERSTSRVLCNHNLIKLKWIFLQDCYKTSYALQYWVLGCWDKKKIKIDNWKFKQIGFKIKNLLKKYMRKSHSINIALRENGSI